MFLCTEAESTSSKRSYLRISSVDSMILNHLVNSTKEIYRLVYLLLDTIELLTCYYGILID